MVSEFYSWLSEKAQSNPDTYHMPFCCFKSIRGSKKWKQIIAMTKDDITQSYLETEPNDHHTFSANDTAKKLKKIITEYEAAEQKNKIVKKIPPSIRKVLVDEPKREDEIFFLLLDKLCGGAVTPESYLKDLVIQDYAAKLEPHVGKTLEGIRSRELKFNVLYEYDK